MSACALRPGKLALDVRDWSDGGGKPPNRHSLETWLES